MAAHRAVFAVLFVIRAATICAALPVPISSWSLAPSSNVTGTPAQISSANYDASGWLNVTVPCTVMACLLQNGFYPDVFHGSNIDNIPSLQFNQSWWFVPQRCVMSLSAHSDAGTAPRSSSLLRKPRP
jgi:hypothetical protein